jgi:hypothetical protein
MEARPDIVPYDWVNKSDLQLRGQLKKRLRKIGGYRQLVEVDTAQRHIQYACELRLERGLKVFSFGRAVLTGRLRVVLDNSYRKISSCVEAWTGASAT